MASPLPSATSDVARHLLEGFAVAGITVLFAVRMFPAEASLLAVCLAALLTVDSVGRMGAEGGGVRRLSVRIVSLFAGSFLGNCVMALALPDAEVAAVFGRQLAYSPTMEALQRGFGGVGPILLANLYVLVFFVVVAFGFRKGGLMIAVGWNASVWGAVFGTLIKGDDAIARSIAFGLAVAPHMAAEAAAYVLGGLAGVLLGRGALRALLRGEDRWDLLAGAAGRLLGLAVALLMAAAAWEGWAAGPVLRVLAP